MVHPEFFLIPGEGGELRQLTKDELDESDRLLREHYRGGFENIGRIVVAGGFNPPFDSTEINVNLSI